MKSTLTTQGQAMEEGGQETELNQSNLMTSACCSTIQSRGMSLRPSGGDENWSAQPAENQMLKAEDVEHEDESWEVKKKKEIRKNTYQNTSECV